MGRILFWYLILINALAFLVYWWDKKRAEKGKPRISERELLLWAAIGGSLGAFFSMRRFRHKTRKTKFRVLFWLIVVAQIVLIWYLVRPS